MIAKLLSVIYLIVAAVPAFAAAGPGSSGGGKGVVCRDTQGNVTSVELLDLWEAHEIYGRTIPTSTDSMDAQLAANLERLKFVLEIEPGANVDEWDEIKQEHYDITETEALARRLRRTAQRLTSDSPNVRHLRGLQLTLTDDSLELAQPTGACKIEQLVDYVDSALQPIVLMNQDLIDKMDATNQAALYLHEGLYAYLRGYNDDFFQMRDYHETNSVRTRRAIGYVFAGNAFRSLDSILGKSYVMCFGHDVSGKNPTEFFLYDDEKGYHQINTQLFGRPMLGFFPQDEQPALTSKEALYPGTCHSHVANPPIGGGVLGIALIGPVDFQVYFWIGSECVKQHWQSTIVQDARSPFQAESGQFLTCKQIKTK